MLNQRTQPIRNLKPNLESLEGRRLMAADASVFGSELVINADTDGGSLVVERASLGGELVVRSNSHSRNSTELRFDADQIASLRIHGSDHADVIRNKTNLPSIISGYAGDDEIHGGSSADKIAGGIGNDLLKGKNGEDRLWGEAGDDILYGGSGNDMLNGGGGDDTVVGDKGNDKLYGQAGDDLLRGEDGADRLEGGDGNDTLLGGSEADTLYGGNGRDGVFAGGDPGDVADAGPGEDIVVVQWQDDTPQGTVIGFDANEDMQVHFRLDTIIEEASRDNEVGERLARSTVETMRSTIDSIFADRSESRFGLLLEIVTHDESVKGSILLSGGHIWVNVSTDGLGLATGHEGDSWASDEPIVESSLAIELQTSASGVTQVLGEGIVNDE
jgi:hypothetical protein